MVVVEVSSPPAICIPLTQVVAEVVDVSSQLTILTLHTQVGGWV